MIVSDALALVFLALAAGSIVYMLVKLSGVALMRNQASSPPDEEHRENKRDRRNEEDPSPGVLDGEDDRDDSDSRAYDADDKAQQGSE
ncbi:hypothetical protein [Leifsonia sp. SIMBA_070]|uniref:hypothetical protein n=1 Tax=Leifsonia sp. SIMBA_070 TaxID=3085810 RepID=UPI00397A1D56